MSDLSLYKNWYSKLIEDLKRLEYTGIVMPKHAIGKRILLDFDRFGKPEYGSKRIENIAKDMDVSISDLYKCIQFVRKYPNIVTPLQNLSWRTIVNKYLPENPKYQYQNRLNSIQLPNKKYNIIYADPPWDYGTPLERDGMHGKVNGIGYYVRTAE